MVDIRSSLFGRLAMETGLVTLKQVQECILLQTEYEQSGRKVPRLGELMASKGYLTAEQVRQILRQQKAAAVTVPAAPPPDPILSLPRIDIPADEAYAEEDVDEDDDDDDDDDDPARSTARRGGECFGSFRVVKRIGCDAAGYTYKAKFLPKKMHVVLRVLSKQRMAENPEYVKLFEEQVRRATDLKHPGIQRVVAAGRQFGRDYYAAQYIEGISLRRVLESRGRMDIPFALEIVRQVGKALEHGHARGIYHQEIRPSNILLTPNRNALLVAYGVAHDVVGNLELLAEQAGATPFYIAPEQAVREDVGGVRPCDARTDIYCLGATLYHLITGQPPYKGESVEEVLLSLAQDEVVDPALLNPEVTPELARFVVKMMDPEPNRRFQNATLLLQALEPIIGSYSGGGEVTTRGALPVRPGTRPMLADHSTMVTDVSRNRNGGDSHHATRGRAERRARKGKIARESDSNLMLILGMIVLGVALAGLLLVALRGKPQPERPSQQFVVPRPAPTYASPTPQGVPPSARPPRQETPTAPRESAPEPAKIPEAPDPDGTAPVLEPEPEPAPEPKEEAEGARPPFRGLFGLEAND